MPTSIDEETGAGEGTTPENLPCPQTVTDKLLALVWKTKEEPQEPEKKNGKIGMF